MNFLLREYRQDINLLMIALLLFHLLLHQLQYLHEGFFRGLKKNELLI